jgi:hypothetical protein
MRQEQFDLESRRFNAFPAEKLSAALDYFQNGHDFKLLLRGSRAQAHAKRWLFTLASGLWSFYFRSMKTTLPLVLCLLAARPLYLAAADQFADATALAAQRDSEERIKRLSADIQTVLDTQELIQKRQEEFRQQLQKLSDEVRSLKEDKDRSSANSVSREELRKYIEHLKEQLDEQRESDKKLILSSIKELGKTAPPPAVVEAPKTNSRHATEPTDDVFLYIVKKNDRLLDIIAVYNEEYQKHGQGKITLEQVLKANPNLKPDHLVAGRKIRIPAPPKDAKGAKD